MRYVSFDQWIVEAFTMSAWFKCSCAPNFSVKLVHARSACQQLMLKLSFAISARLSAQKWGPCLCRGRFLIEIDFVSSEGSCCNRQAMSRSCLQIFYCVLMVFGRLISLALHKTTPPLFICPYDGSLARKIHTDACQSPAYILCEFTTNTCSFSLICLPRLLRKHLMKPLFQI